MTICLNHLTISNNPGLHNLLSTLKGLVPLVLPLLLLAGFIVALVLAIKRRGAWTKITLGLISAICFILFVGSLLFFGVLGMGCTYYSDFATPEYMNDYLNEESSYFALRFLPNTQYSFVPHGYQPVCGNNVCRSELAIEGQVVRNLRETELKARAYLCLNSNEVMFFAGENFCPGLSIPQSCENERMMILLEFCQNP